MADGIALHALLPDRIDSLAERARSSLCENEQVGGMKLAWDFVGGQLHDALKSVLDADLIALLAECWAEAPEVQALADPAKHPKGERSVIALGAHDFAREVNPVIAVTVGSCPCVELQFTFAIAANISGVRMSVVDAHIVSVDLGDVWGSGQLSLQGQPLHPPVESRKLQLPTEFQFQAPGIAIGR